MLRACSDRPNWVIPPAFAGAGSALDCSGAIDPKDAVLVAVERERLTVCLEILAGCLEVVEEPAPGLNRGRFRLDELQMHQAAGGVVDIDQQRALRTAVLEPPVLGTVDLHQFTETIAPSAGLMDALQPVSPANPNTGTDHPLPQGLDAEIQAMKFGQLLGRQGRTKIGVALTDDGQHSLAEHRTQCSVAAIAAFPGDHTIRTVSSEGLQ
jgi:hypothetical protein